MMATATYQNHWRNGDGGAVSEYKLEPPYQGNETVHVVAFRSVTKRMVTQILTVDGKDLSDCIDGATSHKEALASIGYKAE